jgi:hypothetical protein
LLIASVGFSKGEEQEIPNARHTAQNPCARDVFLRYIQDGLEITKQEAAAITALRPTMEFTIAQRRLQEDFCAQFARCVFPDTEQSALKYSMAFESCLRDEVLEQYEIQTDR